METQPNIEDIQKTITPQNLMPLKIIYLALFLGQIIFAVIIFIIHLSYTEYPQLSQAGAINLMNILTIAVGFVALLCYFLFFLTHRFLKILINLSNRQNFSASDRITSINSTSASVLLMKLKVILIVRLALLEMPAFFGLVVILVGILNGAIYQQMDFLINALPLAIFILYVLNNFPTQERVYAQLEQISRED